jgi:hypothetical protein
MTPNPSFLWGAQVNTNCKTNEGAVDAPRSSVPLRRVKSEHYLTDPAGTSSSKRLRRASSASSAPHNIRRFGTQSDLTRLVELDDTLVLNDHSRFDKPSRWTTRKWPLHRFRPICATIAILFNRSVSVQMILHSQWHDRHSQNEPSEIRSQISGIGYSVQRDAIDVDRRLKLPFK